jgi:hypothetical protein
MVQRRTLSQALQTSEFTEAAIAFVNGSASQAAESIEYSDKAQTTAKSPPPKPSGDASGSGTVSMTFRLPSELCSRLLRVSLDRKLKRQKPFTQQDIMAEALMVWLKNLADSL